MQKTLQVEIIKRAIGDKNFSEFLQQYKEASYKSRTLKQPSQSDMRIVSHLRKVQSISQVAKDLGITAGKIHGAIARASTYNK